MRRRWGLGGRPWLTASALALTLITPAVVAPLTSDAGAVESGTASGLGSGPALTDNEVAMLAARTQQSTLRVASRGCEGLTLGTAFATDMGLFTNDHLVAGASEIKVDRATPPLIDPAFLPVLAASSGLDSALLAAIAVPKLTLADQPAADGEAVLMIGHPGGYGLEWLQGTVHHYDFGTAWGHDGQVMLIEAETVPGYSGGPVVNRDGEVVAMLSGFDLATELTIAVPTAELSNWVAQEAALPVQAKEVAC